MPDLFRLPGPGRFAAGIEALVRGGRSVLIRVPAGEQVPVLAALTDLLEPEGYPCHRLPQEEEQTPARALAWTLSIDKEIDGVEPVTALLAHERLRRGDVFMGGLTADSWPDWQRFLRSFEQEVAGWDPYERPRLVLQWRVQDPATPSVPETALCAVRIWRGCVGELDLRVHAGSQLLGREMTSVQRKLLTEQVVALSLWDCDLADRLLDLKPAELAVPLTALTAYAKQRGWTAQTPLSWELGTEEEFEGASQRHSAHAAVTGQTELIRRRQWEAQASVVLPLIDRLRRDLINKGFDHFRRVLPGIAKPADLYDHDIGSLCSALGRDGPRDLRNWAENLRWYRNELSHLRPLPFELLYNYQGWPV